MKIEYIIEISDVFGVVVRWVRDTKEEAEKLKKIITYGIEDAGGVTIEVKPRAHTYDLSEVEFSLED